MGILTIVNDLNLAAEVADNIIMIKDGEVYADGSPKSVLVPEKIKDILV